MFKATGEEYYPVMNVMSVRQTIEQFILGQGHILYPHEIILPWHGFLDVACISPFNELYAFEIKEKGGYYFFDKFLVN